MRGVILLLSLMLPTPALADLRVKTAEEFLQAAADAKAGETIVMNAGTYDVADVKIRRDLSIRGDGAVTLMASRPVAKGLLNPVTGASLRVENLNFLGARSPDKNGAGIRHDGDDLIIIDSIFEGNENGVLATGAQTGRITITSSRFLNNGHGDGYSHGIYIVTGARLDISSSAFIGTRVGHHIKSLAEETIITESVMDDGEGRTSYAVDASKGGTVTIAGNTITQASDSFNPAIINYDITRGGAPTALTITGNRIINRRRGAKFLRNPTSVLPVIYGNEVLNENGTRLEYRDIRKPISSVAPRKEPAAWVIPQQSGDAPQTLTPVSLEANAPFSSPRTGILKAPLFDQASPALARFKLRNNWKTNATPDFVSFGVAFTLGSLQSDEPVAAMFGSEIAPLQIDIKSTHDDGSVRHGVVTLLAPGISPGEETEGRIVKLDGVGGAAFEPVQLLTARYTLPVAIRFYFADDTTEDVAIDLRDAVLREFSRPMRGWLSGTIVEERRIEIPVAPHLRLRADVRVFRDGDIRTSLAFINDKSFAPGRRDSVYDVRIGDPEAPAYEAKKIPHHRASNWRRVFWTGDQQRLHVMHRLDDIVSSGAVLPFDASLGVDAKGIAQNAERLKDLPPMSPALVQPHFPRTGGRSDIGIVPTWTANYLVAQTEASKRVMLENAEVAGAIPWHYSDDRTGEPLSIEDYPNFWADKRGREAQYGSDRPHADIFASSDGGWTIDHAHKPALSAVPWLVTGDRYYADELAMQAAWALFGTYPVWRDNSLKVTDIGQVRATAWSLRDLSDASFLLPDDHESKEYLLRAFSENISRMKKKYTVQRAMQSAGALEGFIEEHVGRNPERISPWQNDYVAIALWLSAHRGSENATSMLAWMSGFETGRFLHPDFDNRLATAGVLPAKTADGKAFVESWAVLSQKTRAGLEMEPDRFLSYPALADGHVGAAGAALSAISAANGHPDALAALAVWLRETKSYPMWLNKSRGDVYRRNGFFFQTMAPNGASYSRSNVQWGGNGGAGDDLTISGRRGGKLEGQDGDDLLLGLQGADIISGGAGDDVLSGGGGNDVMIGGPGSDIFSLTTSLAGNVVIEDFDPCTDTLFLAGDGIIEQSPEGLHIVFPKGRGSLLIKNLLADQLNQMNFRQFDSTFLH